MNPRTVHIDCRQYRGDRPCLPHKKDGVFCETCPSYDPIHTRVLMIKLGAAGDVLRTTPLIASIQDQYPGAHITWLTAPSSYPLIQHIPTLDRVLVLSSESLVILDAETFDVCINFDLADEAAALCERMDATTKLGYRRSPRGAIVPCTDDALEWLDMSMWDDRKSANTRTYQSHMRTLIGAPDTNHPILVPVPEDARLMAKRFAESHSLGEHEWVIGFNVGAGHRWQHKKWTVEGFCQLAEMIHAEWNVPIMILYGPEDEPRAHEVMSSLPVSFIDGGAHASVHHFAAVLDLCDIVVTGDTLALHMALGLGKRTVCLVGPTSTTELELYDQGVILQGEIDCLGCYLPRCDKDPHCMNLLSAERVMKAVREQRESTHDRAAT